MDRSTGGLWQVPAIVGSAGTGEASKTIDTSIDLAESGPRFAFGARSWHDAHSPVPFEPVTVAPGHRVTASTAWGRSTVRHEALVRRGGYPVTTMQAREA